MKLSHVSEIENPCPEMTGTLLGAEPGIICFASASEELDADGNGRWVRGL
jgi:hypothetical protein